MKRLKKEKKKRREIAEKEKQVAQTNKNFI